MIILLAFDCNEHAQVTRAIGVGMKYLLRYIIVMLVLVVMTNRP